MSVSPTVTCSLIEETEANCGRYSGVLLWILDAAPVCRGAAATCDGRCGCQCRGKGVAAVVSRWRWRPRWRCAEGAGGNVHSAR